MSSGYKWKPLREAVALPPSEALLQATMKHYGCDRAEAIRLQNEEIAGSAIWRNDLYQVMVHRHDEDGYVHLNIRRVDGFPGRDWRHFQQIKNELVGPECEAVELYPAESRLVDTSNKYHLYVVTDPTFRFPFGWTKRDVQHDATTTEPGMRQRPPMQFDGKEAAS